MKHYWRRYINLMSMFFDIITTLYNDGNPNLQRVRKFLLTYRIQTIKMRHEIRGSNEGIKLEKRNKHESTPKKKEMSVIF